MDLSEMLDNIKAKLAGMVTALEAASVTTAKLNVTQAKTLENSKALGLAFETQTKSLTGLTSRMNEFHQALTKGGQAGIAASGSLAQLDKGVVSLAGNFTKMQNASITMSKLSNELKGSGQAMVEASKSAAMLGANLLRVTGILGGAGFVAYQQAIGMQKQMVAQQQALGATYAASAPQINKEVESIGHALGVNRVQMAGLYAEFAKDGYGMQQVMGQAASFSTSQLGALSEATSKLAMMTGMNLGSAKDAVKAFMGEISQVQGVKGFDNQVKALNTTFAQLSNIANVSNIPIDVLMKGLPGLGAAAKNMNASLAQTGAVMAALNQAGIPAEQTVTGLQFTLNRLFTGGSSGGASASGKSATFALFEKFQISLKNADGTARPMLQVLAELAEKMKTVGLTTKEAGELASAFGTRQAGRMTAGLDSINQYLTVLKAGGDAAQTSFGKILAATGEDPNKGASAQSMLANDPAALKRVMDPYTARQRTYMQSTPFKMAQAKQDILGIAGQLGESFLPVLQKILQYVDKIMQAFSHMSTPIKEIVVGLLAALAAAGPLMLVFGNVGQLLGHGVKGLGSMIPGQAKGMSQQKYARQYLAHGGEDAYRAHLAEQGKLLGVVGDKIVIVNAKNAEQKAALADILATQKKITDAANETAAAEAKAAATTQSAATAKKAMNVNESYAAAKANLYPNIPANQAVTNAQRAAISKKADELRRSSYEEIYKPDRKQFAFRKSTLQGQAVNELGFGYNDPATMKAKISELRRHSAMAPVRANLAGMKMIAHPVATAASLKELRAAASKALDKVPVIGALKTGASGAKNMVKSGLSKGMGKVSGVASFIPGGDQVMGLASTAMELGPMLPVALAVGGAILLISKNWDKVKTGITNGVKNVTAAFKGIIDSVLKPFEQLFGNLFNHSNKAGASAKSMGDVWKTVGKSINTVLNGVAAAIRFLSPTIQTVAGVIASVLGVVVNVVRAVAELFQGHFGKAFEYIRQAAGYMVKAVINMFMLIPEAISGVIGKIVGLISKIPGMKSIGNGIKDGANAAKDFLSGIGDKVGNFIGGSGMTGGTAVDIPDPFGKSKSKINKAANDAGHSAGAAFGDGIAPGIDTTDPGNIASSLKEKLKEAVNKELDKMIKSAQDAYDKQAKAQVDAIDKEIKALDEKKKAEELVIKQEEEAAKRREIIEQAQLERDNYLRDRAGLIYEGKVGDALALDVKQVKANEATTDQLHQLDVTNQKELVQSNYDAQKQILEDKKKKLEDGIQATKDAMNDEFAAIKANTPKTAQEYQDRMNQVEAILRKSGVDTATFEKDYGKDAGTAWNDANQAAIHNAETDKFFSDQGTQDVKTYTGAAGAEVDAESVDLGITDPNNPTQPGSQTGGHPSAGIAPSTTPALSERAVHHAGGMNAKAGYGQEYPALLQGGEYVLRKEAVNAIGVDQLHSLNKFHTGGYVGKADSLVAGKAAGVIPKMFHDKLLKIAEARESKGLGLGPKLQALFGASGGGGDIIAYARKFLGIPYLFGGTDPAIGLDCSGFVQQVFAHFGKMLPRVSWDQLKQGTPIPDISQALPGDLLGFEDGGHISIYEGGGRMIDAPHTGSNVREEGIWDGLMAIRRIMGNVTGGAGTFATGTAQQIGQAMAAARGWTGQNWTDLVSLWNKESGWDASIVNTPNGPQDMSMTDYLAQYPDRAYGIPQALGSAQGHPYNLGDIAGQISWGLDYIGQRYGNPSGAWSHEMGFNWYDNGGILKPGLSMAMNGTGQPEYILTSDQWGKLTRSMATIAGTASNGAAGGNSVTQHNIQVDTFIGEKAWFDKMMREYQNTTARTADRASGKVNRVIGNAKDTGVRYSKGD